MITEKDIGRKFKINGAICGSVIILDVDRWCVLTTFTSNQNTTWKLDIDEDPDFEWVELAVLAPKELSRLEQLTQLPQHKVPVLKFIKDHTGHKIIWNEANGEKFRVCTDCCEEVW